MKRARGVRITVAALIVLLTAFASVMQPAGALAQPTTGQATSSQTAGTSTVTFDESWQYDPAGADPTSVFLVHRDIPTTMFMYGEVVDGTVSDPNAAIDQFAIGFFGEFGDQDHQVVASDVIDQGTAWRLYTVSQQGVPFGMLTTANTTAIPGSVVVALLIAPAGSFDLGVTAVQEGIDVNGAGSPFASFDAAELSGIIEGGGQAGVPTETATSTGGLTLPPIGGTTTPEAGVTPPTQSGGLTLPPLNPTTTPASQTTPATTTGQGQTVVVNTATVSYGPGWSYEEASSTPNELAFFSSEASATTLFGYATVADTSGDAGASLNQFNEGFFGSFGATNVQQVAGEVLPSGHAYTLSTGEQGSVPVVVLAYADVTTAPGEFRVQVLIAATSEFDAALTNAMQAFQIDGVGAFSDLDPAALSAAIAGGATTTDPVSTATTTTDPVSTATTDPSTNQTGGSTLSVTGDVSQFEAQDAQGSCDAIGWAATAPGQIPASEADINYRSVCVGGAVFFAICGVVPGTQFGAPDPGMAWVQCDVTARVDGAPMMLTMFDFELQDGAGTAYQFDLLAGISAIETVKLFPETEIATGQTGTGSVIFSVPANAPGPWVLSVNPESVAATGGQPGSLVISGELQPFEMVAP